MKPKGVRAKNKAIEKALQESGWSGRRVSNILKHHDGPLDDICADRAYQQARRAARFAFVARPDLKED